jgi:hypothetical protein
MVRRVRSATTWSTVDDVVQIALMVGRGGGCGGATLSVTAAVISSAVSHYLGRRRNVFSISRAD